MIKRVNVKQTYPLRSLVLRPNQPIETCYYQEDEQGSAFHLAWFDESDEVRVIASFYQENSAELLAKNAYRLRGMACHPDFRRKGLANLLLKKGLDICQQEGADLLWCNARITASDFYQKQGFERHGVAFDIIGIGAHYLMYKSFA